MFPLYDSTSHDNTEHSSPQGSVIFAAERQTHSFYPLLSSLICRRTFPLVLVLNFSIADKAQRHSLLDLAQLKYVNIAAPPHYHLEPLPEVTKLLAATMECEMSCNPSH